MVRGMLSGGILILVCAAQGRAGEAAIPMRDGPTLAAEIFLPPKPGRYPCVLIQTPYDKRRLSAAIAGAAEGGGETGRGAFSDLGVLLDREHYAYVVVDWRGFFGSRAAMAKTDRRTWRRGQDGHDTIEWIARQEWSDGKVGTWGGSALGKQQFDSAAERPPHLVCCVPLIASMGTRYADFYEGGVLLEAHVERLDQLGFDVSRMVRAAPRPDGPVWPLVERRTDRTDRIDVPCLLITGWWDNYPAQVIATFESILSRGGPGAREGSKLLIGPWDHVGVGVAGQGALRFDGAALESGRAAKAFLDFHLRGVRDNGWAGTDRVRWWQLGEECWKGAESWSAISRGSITCDVPLSRTVIRHDPRRPSPTLGGANLPPLPHGPTRHESLEARDDVAVLPLPGPLTLLGEAELTLRVSANRPDCNLTARLCVRKADGTTTLLGDSAIRLARRRGGHDPVAPGEGCELTMRFPPTAITLREGEELRIYLSPSNWPRYERHTHTEAPHWDEASAVDLELNFEAKARLKLPTPTRKAE